MSKPQLMHMVDDDILTGYVERNRQWCEACNFPVMCIHINEIHLPEEVGEPSNRLIAYRPTDDGQGVEPITFIGIGCGCYARFHRQIAHITTRVRASE